MYDTPERHPRVTPAELAYINSDPPEATTPVPWATLFPHQEAWAFAIGKFMTDPIWWLYLFWLAGLPPEEARPLARAASARRWW